MIEQPYIGAAKDADTLRAFARDLTATIEAIESDPLNIKRGRLLDILVQQVRACEDRLVSLRLYAERVDRQTADFELVRGYRRIGWARIAGGVER